MRSGVGEGERALGSLQLGGETASPYHKDHKVAKRKRHREGKPGTSQRKVIFEGNLRPRRLVQCSEGGMPKKVHFWIQQPVVHGGGESFSNPGGVD